uniref:Synaptogyrin n=1 Tax=Hadrurus spadix TaxID=141984 RepID=A0A1W7R9G9_9SCOR
MNGGAYGAGKAGAPFDPFGFIQRPQVILRLLCWLFAVIVFGCIAAEGWLDDKCLYNNDTNACNFGVGIGVIAFIASIAFLVTEALFDSFSSVKIRRRAVLADLGFSAFWAFLWFVAFCYLCDAWRQSPMPKGSFGVNNIRAAIAFSFFSIFVWAACAFFAFQRYRQGADSAFAPAYEAEPHEVAGGMPYSTYPEGPEINEAYHEPPFSGGQSEKIPTGAPNFQPPAY